MAKRKSAIQKAMESESGTQAPATTPQTTGIPPEATVTSPQAPPQTPQVPPVTPPQAPAAPVKRNVFHPRNDLSL
ncbi:MAG: hypothetical protein LBI89_03965 [Prevotellaceae bacterium]|jgi:hypothetical protein|nr:hypothetical protein [Prevotellaceae bacterium]